VYVCMYIKKHKHNVRVKDAVMSSAGARSAEESAGATMGRRSCIFSSSSQLVVDGAGEDSEGPLVGVSFFCRLPPSCARHLEGHILTTPKYDFLLQEGPPDDDDLFGKSFTSSNQRLHDLMHSRTYIPFAVGCRRFPRRI
jgi:hypothetical protein